MRIAFLVSEFPKLSETFILNQVVGAIERGHEVDIYTRYIRDWSNVHPDVNRYQLWERTYSMPPLPYNYLWRAIKGVGLFLSNFHRAPRSIARSLNIFAYGEQAFNLWLLYTAVALLDTPCDYDIIHCQFGTLGYRGLALKRLLQPTPKLLMMFRGFDISAYLEKGGKRVYPRLFKDVDYCLANCNFFRQRVIDLGLDADRIAVHFSGLDVEKFTFQPRQLVPGEPIRLATTGRLVEKKGIEYAIRAVVRQAKHDANLCYYIIGDGPLRETLEALIRELDAQSYIHLLGWKNESEIISILDTCHVFIAPSITASNGDRDAPINVLKEAMAMGLPVLSTNHGGIPELVEDGVSGFLVPERDTDALTEKLGDLLKHPDRWPEMGRAGRAFVETHFDLNALNDRLLQLYERLIEQDRNETSIPQSDRFYKS